MNNNYNIFDLKNKTAFVLGGLGLIGIECCKALHFNGANVVALDKNIKGKNIIAKLNNENSTKILFEQFDISHLKKGKDKYNKIISKFSTPDIFINCVYPKNKNWSKSNFKDISFKALEDSISLQLSAVSWINKLIADSMIIKKTGSIIQLASIYGFIGQDLNLYKNLQIRENMSYSIIKGGLINLTRQMASYYGHYNIRVNSISPGAIKSEDRNDLTNNKIFINRYLQKTPIKRLGNASDVASSATFLSSEASAYITGINLVVDGGLTII